MRLYTVETRNFEFHIFCSSRWNFEVLFKKAWRKHCEQYCIPFDRSFFSMLIQDYGNGYMEVKDGAVYRDKQVIHDKILLEEYRGHDYGEDSE